MQQTRQVDIPVGTFQSAEIYATVTRCGCNDPMSHARVEVAVYTDLKKRRHGLEMNRRQFDLMRAANSERYIETGSTFGSLPCPTPLTTEDRGLIGRVERDDIKSYPVDVELSLRELMVEVVKAFGGWCKRNFRFRLRRT